MTPESVMRVTSARLLLTSELYGQYSTAQSATDSLRRDRRFGFAHRQVAASFQEACGSGAPEMPDSACSCLRRLLNFRAYLPEIKEQQSIRQPHQKRWQNDRFRLAQRVRTAVARV